jgi:hypothetical protein
VRDRAVSWLRLHRYLDERAPEDRSNEAPTLDALDACRQLALAGGAFLARPLSPQDPPDGDLDRRERRFSATCDGFDVHGAVRLEAGDDEGRERLLRYCTRPPFALARISVLRDGRIAYQVKSPRQGRTHRVMTPMDFLARLGRAARGGAHRARGERRAHDDLRQALGAPRRGQAVREVEVHRVGRPQGAHLRQGRPRLPTLREEDARGRHRHRPCYGSPDPRAPGPTVGPDVQSAGTRSELEPPSDFRFDEPA